MKARERDRESEGSQGRTREREENICLGNYHRHKKKFILFFAFHCDGFRFALIISSLVKFPVCAFCDSP